MLKDGPVALRRILELQGEAELGLAGLRCRPLPRPALKVEREDFTLVVTKPKPMVLYLPSVGVSNMNSVDGLLKTCVPLESIMPIKERYSGLHVVRSDEVGLTWEYKTGQRDCPTGYYMLAATGDNAEAKR